MKKQPYKNFELLCAAGICILLATPFWASAQKKERKEWSIEINNSDTVINGQPIGKLSKKERKEALDILNDRPMKKGVKNSVDKEIFVERREMPELPEINFNIKTDSLKKVMVIRGDSLMKNARKMSNQVRELRFNTNTNDNTMWAFDNNRLTTVLSGRKRENSQSFNFSNVDKDGIETRMNFRLSDASAADVKKLGGTEEKSGENSFGDVVLYPDFTTGNITLNLKTSSTSPTTLQLTNRDGQTIWTEKSGSGKISKSFSLPKNGLYFLVLKQGAKTSVKQLIKE